MTTVAKRSAKRRKKGHDKKWQGMHWIRNSMREAILARDLDLCVYCLTHSDDVYAAGGKMSVDHIIPRNMGGSAIPSNLVTGCMSCNSSKGHLSPLAFADRCRLRGIDPILIFGRLSEWTARPLDREEGRRRAALYRPRYERRKGGQT